MKRSVAMPWIAAVWMMALFAFTPAAAQAQTCTVAQIDPVVFPGTGPAPGSTLEPAPDGTITFSWCNASADYFVIVETVFGAHDIFFAFTGGAGGGAGQNFLTLPVCSPTQNLHCIPALGETIFFTLDTVKNKTLLGSFLYTYTAPGTRPPQPVPTALAVDSQSVTESAAPQTVTLTATATAASTVNQGTVTFQVVDAAASNVGAAVTSTTLTNGSASVSYLLPAGTPAGGYTIRATYSGGTSFLASSGTGTLTVNPAPPLPAVTSTTVDPQAVTFDAGAQNVTLTAAVSAASAVNEGTVTFQVQDGAVNVGAAVTSATLAGGNASVIYALPAGLAVGNYTIQASYSGGTAFQPSSGSGTLTVSPAPPPNQAVTVTIVSNGTAAFSSDVQHVTLEAAVSSPGGTVNEGTVTFQVMDGPTSIGTAVPSATLTNGLAAVSYALPAGLASKDYAIQASYSGGLDFLPSGFTGTLSITKAPSTTTFTTAPPPSLPLGGTYSPAATSTGDGTLIIGASGACSITSGVVTITAASGTCTVTATESEGPNFFGSSATPQIIAVSATITIGALEARVDGLTLGRGIKNSLMSKLRAAQASLDRGNRRAAIHQLVAFIHEVRALENGGRMDRPTADSLIDGAIQIIDQVRGHHHASRPGHDRDD